MKQYICPNCGQQYLECDLCTVKCSENQVGVYPIDYCIECFLKKHKIVNLEEAKREKRFELEIFEDISNEELKF